MNIKKNIAVTILTTSFLISGISNPIGYNVSEKQNYHMGFEQ